tara:strand:+ start:303 stop:749 length:447 start_codon:yes stop_codon:yes gene_type:complete
MIKVAMVKDNGEIQTIVCPSDDSLYTDGESYGEVTARIIPFNTDAHQALELWYWHDDAWAIREQRPNHLSKWEGQDVGWVTDVQELNDNIREIRGVLLTNSDWTQFPDSPLTTAKKAEWVTYRQALRDIPEDYSSATSLDDVVWPTKP